MASSLPPSPSSTFSPSCCLLCAARVTLRVVTLFFSSWPAKAQLAPVSSGQFSFFFSSLLSVATPPLVASGISAAFCGSSGSSSVNINRLLADGSSSLAPLTFLVLLAAHAVVVVVLVGDDGIWISMGRIPSLMGGRDAIFFNIDILFSAMDLASVARELAKFWSQLDYKAA